MGQYIQIGIIYEATIPKKNIKWSGNYTYDAILDALSKHVNLDLFDITDTTDAVHLTIKNHLLLNNIKPFLLEQYTFRSSHTLDNKLIQLPDNQTYDELINNVECKYYKYLQPMKDHTWYLVDNLDTNVHFKALGFFLEGKAYIECYRNLLDYMLNLIKHSTDNPLKGALVAEIG